MSDQNQNPTAQGAQPGTTADQTQSPAPQPGLSQQQFEGIQKRFDEFSAKIGERDRALEELRQQNMNLTMMLAQRQQMPQPDPYLQSQPQVEVDPDMRRQLEAVLTPVQRQFQQQLAQVSGMAAQTAFESQVAAELPVVAARARQIWNSVLANGDHLKGFQPQQAIMLARGENLPALLEAAKRQQQVAAGNAFNSQPGAIPNQGHVPNVSTPNTNQLPEPDPNEDPDAAADYYAKRLQGKTF